MEPGVAAEVEPKVAVEKPKVAAEEDPGVAVVVELGDAAAFEEVDVELDVAVEFESGWRKGLERRAGAAREIPVA